MGEVICVETVEASACVVVVASVVGEVVVEVVVVTEEASDCVFAVGGRTVTTVAFVVVAIFVVPIADDDDDDDVAIPTPATTEVAIIFAAVADPVNEAPVAVIFALGSSDLREAENYGEAGQRE